MFQPVPVFVGLRYSLAREHSFFVSFITWVSLLGVALGVLALITVLSVMNGFETELRTRLLSLSAHATLSAAGGGPIADWRQRIEQLQGAPGLVGAAPFLDIDAMLSRPPSMSGAIVRGIDPALEPQVSTIGEAHARGQAQRPQAGTESHHSRPHAGLPAASRRGRHRHGHDPGQLGGGGRHRAPAAGIRGLGNVRGGLAGARQRAGARESSGRGGPARTAGTDRHTAQVQRCAAGAGAGAQSRSALAAGAAGARLDAGERRRTFAPFASKKP